MKIISTKKLCIIILALLCAITVGVAGSLFATAFARAETPSSVNYVDTFPPESGEGEEGKDFSASVEMTEGEEGKDFSASVEMTEGEGDPHQSADADSFLLAQGEAEKDFSASPAASVEMTKGEENTPHPSLRDTFPPESGEGEEEEEYDESKDEAVLREKAEQEEAERLAEEAKLANMPVINEAALQPLAEATGLTIQQLYILARYSNETEDGFAKKYNAESLQELHQRIGTEVGDLLFYGVKNNLSVEELWAQFNRAEKALLEGEEQTNTFVETANDYVESNLPEFFKQLDGFAEGLNLPSAFYSYVEEAEEADLFGALLPPDAGTNYYSTASKPNDSNWGTRCYNSGRYTYFNKSVTAGDTFYVEFYLYYKHSSVALSSSYMKHRTPTTTFNSGWYYVDFQGNTPGGSYYITFTLDSSVTSNYKYSGGYTSCYYYLYLYRPIRIPTISSDGGVSGNTKTVPYTGSPQIITLNYDSGSNFINYSASYMSLAQPRHSATSGYSTLKLQATNAGTYTITITHAGSYSTDSNYAYSYGYGQRWNDNSDTTYTFYLVIKQPAPVPTLVNADGVDYGTNTKTVQYNLNGNTIAFSNANSTYVQYSLNSSAMTQQSWSGTNLTLKATNVGTYTITFSYTSNAGGWADFTTGNKVFKLVITAASVEKPTLVAEPGVSGNTKNVDFTGAMHTISLQPAVSGLINVNAPGMTQKSWDTTTRTLTLQASIIQTYTITITPLNSNIRWDDGTSSAVVFKLVIGPEPMAVPEMSQEEEGVNGRTKSVTYTATAQSATLQPVIQSKVAITAQGATVTFKDNALVVTATNAGTYSIIIACKDDKVIWEKSGDNPRTHDAQVYTFIINPKRVKAPTLAAKDNENGDNTKTVIYNPEGGGTPYTMTIEGLSIAETTWTAVGMVQDSWVDNVLVLRATDAKTYTIYINVKANYVWDGEAPPEFVLVIKRFKIALPELIVEDDDGAEEADGKHVTYGKDSKTVLYDPKVTHHIMVWAGTTRQVSCENVGMERTWGENDGETDLSRQVTFSAKNVSNYTISVTPGSNYCWDDDGNNGDGSYSPVNFFLVIRPITAPSPAIWYTDLNGVWQESADDGGHSATVVFNGLTKRTSIICDKASLRYQLVDKNAVVSDNGLTWVKWETEEGLDGDRLEFTAVHAKDYVIRLSFTDPNYAWDNGDPYIDYHFIIAPQPIAMPVIMSQMCSNNNNPVNQEWVGDNFLEGTYNSHPYVMAIKLKKNPLISVACSGGYDGYGMELLEWNETEDILYIQATAAGLHTATLTITNDDYCWADFTGQAYTFEITIGAHVIADPVFLYNSYEIVNGKRVYSGDYEGLKDKINDKTEDNFRGDTFTLSDSDWYTVTYSAGEEYILFAPSSFDLLTFLDTPYSEQVKYEVTSSQNNQKLTQVEFNDYFLRLSGLNADEYTVTITPTDNYIWNDASTDPKSFTFAIIPRVVAAPDIHDFADGSVDFNNRTRTVDYNRNAQPLSLDLEFAQAITVVKAPGMTLYEGKDDNCITNPEYSHLTYTAENSGTYTLSIKLSSTMNYEWEHTTDSTEVQEYRLVINKIPIQVPHVYLVLRNQDGSVNTDADYTNVSGGANEGSGNAIDLNLHNTTHQRVEIYDAEKYLIIVKGKAVGLGDVSYAFTASNPNNSDMVIVEQDKNHKDANAQEITAKKVNTYTLTISFSSPNYYWSGLETTGEEGDPGTNDFDTTQQNAVQRYTFIIQKRAVKLPTIHGENNIDWDGNYLYKDVDYDVHKERWNIKVEGIQTKYMTIAVNNTNYTRIETLGNETDADGNKLVLMETLQNIVPNPYFMTVALDTANVCWTDASTVGTANEDLATKRVYIRINKRAVGVPVIVSNSNAANKYIQEKTYTGEEQTYIISNIYTDWVNASFPYPDKIVSDKVITKVLAPKEELDLSDVDGISYADLVAEADRIITNRHATENMSVLIVTTKAPVETYYTRLSLKLTNSMKWADETLTGNALINPIDLRLSVTKVQLAKPTIESLSVDDGVLGNTKTVTYKIEDGNGVPYKFNILNFIKDDDKRWMSVEVISSLKFESSNVRPEPAGDKGYAAFNTTLLYTATDVGTYIVRITLSGNARFEDNSTYVDYTLIINKQTFDTPYIIGGKADDPLAGDLDKDGTVTGDVTDLLNVKTVTFNLNEQYIRIANVLNEATGYYADIDSFTGNLVRVDSDNTNVYVFKARDAGTYTVTLKIRDYKNKKWADTNAETIRFTFKINILQIDKPEEVFTYLITNESITDAKDTMDAQYDGNYHTFMWSGVNSAYFTWSDTTTYATNKDTDEYKVKFAQYDNTLVKVADDSEEGFHYRDTRLTVAEIFGADYLNKEDVLNSEILPENFIFTMAAKYVGTYKITLSIKENNNVRWKGNTYADVVFTLNINKKSHEAPKVAPGTPSSVQYTGDYISFSFANVINGLDQNGEVVSDWFENWRFDSYEGKAKNDPKLELVSWYDGILTVKAREVGTYTLVVSIRDPETTMWSNNTATTIAFSVKIIPKVLTAEFTYSCQDEAINASLAAGATSWPSSAQVDVTLRLYGVMGRAIYDDDGNPVLDDANNKTYEVDKAINYSFYYLKNGTSVNNELELQESGVSERQTDGSYYAWYRYSIPSGLTINTYYACAVHTAAEDNYSLSLTRGQFRITADNAKFDPSTLMWRWYIDDGPRTNIDSGKGTSANNRFELEYDKIKNGGTYRFDIYLTPEAMGESTNVANALIKLDVKLNGYGGTTAVKNAGDYAVTATIAVNDATKYYFPTTVFTLYYRINPAKYDLSFLSWNYDKDEPFVYSGGYKSVSMVSSLTNGAFPTGLSIKNYTNNSQRYVGTYTAGVVFANSNGNYITPVSTNKDTYILPEDGVFEPTCTWQITPYKLDARWKSSQNTSAGTTTFYPVLENYSSYVTYSYEKCTNPHIVDGDDGNKIYVPDAGDIWQPVSKLEHQAGKVDVYRIKATLKGTKGNGRSDYANNYELVFPEDDLTQQNPQIFVLGANEKGIYVHLEFTQDGLTPEQNIVDYEQLAYNGKPYLAKVFIDLNGSGNDQIDESKITITYYNKSNPNKPISAPTKVGKYIIKLTLNYNASNTGTDLTEYALIDAEYEYEIVKGTFGEDEIIWQYTHTDEKGNNVVANYDAEQKKWLIKYDTPVAEGEEDTRPTEISRFSYDGIAHNVSLVTTNSALTIKNKGFTNIEAGDYTTTATFTFDSSQWNAPDVTTTFDWTIGTCILDLSLVKWSKEDDYIYTINRGTPVTYTVELANLPEYLKDKVTYMTSYEGGTAVAGNSGSNVGTYVTTYVIPEITNKNYELGTMPSFVANPYEWTIDVRTISLPESDNSWSEFDGLAHNMLPVLGIANDYDLYYSIGVTYSSNGGSSFSNYTGYNGLSQYNGYNAGLYRFTLSINSGINTADVTNVAWIIPNGNTDGTNKVTTDNQTVDLEIAKTKLNVSGWTQNYEASTVEFSNATSSSKFVAYNYQDANGRAVSLDTILNSPGNEHFFILPYIKSQYGVNIELTYDNEELKKLEFVTMTFDEQNGIYVGEKPKIVSYTVDGKTTFFDDASINARNVSVKYSGKEVTFNIGEWDYYSQFLDVYTTSDELTQTVAGEYSITFTLKKNRTQPLSWGTKSSGIVDRASVTIRFNIDYLLLTIPNIKTSYTYTGNPIEVFQESYTEEQLDALYEEYKDYVEITGYNYTQIGDYQLRLSIKSEFVNTVRWNDGTKLGSDVTQKINWTILPIYIVKPVRDTTLLALLIYDGEEHSVYEALRGYNPTNMSEDLKKLIQYVNLAVEGSRSIDAGDFTAVFSLPDKNYQWSDKTSGNVSIAWAIQKQRIELNKVTWDYKAPFIYTREGDSAKQFSVSITGLPEAIADGIIYTTNGAGGNSAWDVGQYTTRFYFNPDNIDSTNYVVAASIGIDDSINWEIKPRTFVIPKAAADDGVFVKIFNGKNVDLLNYLGFEEGWENYLDVKVLFSADGKDFKTYEGLENSLYLAIKMGYYKLDIGFIEGINIVAGTDDEGNEIEAKNRVVWVENANIGAEDGSIEKQEITVLLSKLEITVTGWNEDKQWSTIKFTTNNPSEFSTLEQLGGMLGIEIRRDADQDNKVYKDRNEIADTGTGATFRLNYVVDEDFAFGISLLYEKEADKVYQFTLGDFGTNRVIWLPIPKIDGDTVRKFTGREQPFSINADVLYGLTRKADLKAELKASYNFNDDWFKSHSSLIEIVSGDLEQTAAGKYDVVIRLITGVNLSWYDSDIYEYYYNASSKQNVFTKKDGVVDDVPAVPSIDRLSKTVHFEIEVVYINKIEIEQFEEAIYKEYVYNGHEFDAITNPETGEIYEIFAELKETYGDLIRITGNKEVNAGDHVIKIELVDPDSVKWTWDEVKTESDKQYGFVWEKQDNGKFKLKYVLLDEDGEPVLVDKNGEPVKLGEDGNYVLIDENGAPVTGEDGGPVIAEGVHYKEYKDGSYTIDAKFKIDIRYKHEYVAVADAAGNLLKDEFGRYTVLKDDGTPVIKYLYDSEGLPLKDEEGNNISIEYIVDEAGMARLYQLKDGKYVEYTDTIDVNTKYTGLFAARYVYDEKGSKVENTEYNSEYIKISIQDFNYMLDQSGNLYKYIHNSDGSYSLEFINIDADEIAFNENGELIRYSLKDDVYVVDPYGEFVLKKELDISKAVYKTQHVPLFDGEIIQGDDGKDILLYAIFEDGKYVLKQVLTEANGTIKRDENQNVIFEPVLVNGEVFDDFVIQTDNTYKVEKISVYVEGTTVLAAEDLGKKFIVIENGEYVIKKVIEQTTGVYVLAELDADENVDFVFAEGPYYSSKEVSIVTDTTEIAEGAVFAVAIEGGYKLQTIVKGEVVDVDAETYKFAVKDGPYFDEELVTISTQETVYKVSDIGKIFAFLQEDGTYVLKQLDDLTSVTEGEGEDAVTTVTAEWKDVEGDANFALDKDGEYVIADGKIKRFVLSESGLFARVEETVGDETVVSFVYKFEITEGKIQVYEQSSDGMFAFVDGKFVNKYDVTESASGTTVSVYVKDTEGSFYKDKDGSYKSVFTVSDSGDKFLSMYQYDANGNRIIDEESTPYKNVYEELLVLGNYELDASGNLIWYEQITNDDGTVEYVESATGEYVLKYEIGEDGNRVKKVYYQLDENGNPIVDAENSTVKVTYTHNEVDNFEIDWNIARAPLAAPTLKEDVNLVYSGTEYDLSKYLNGWSDSFKFLQGGNATDAGDFTAVIAFANQNFYWEGSDLEYVSIEWSIAKATIDLSGLTWNYTEDTVYEYKREEGKAVVYQVKLQGDNLTEYLNSVIVYTTNKLKGSNSATDAGKYITTFELVGIDEKNYIVPEIPEELKEPLVWRIKKKKLTVPTLNTEWKVFDDKEYDLREMLGLEEGYEEYFKVSVKYSNNYGIHLDYHGPDYKQEGDADEWWRLYGSGSYIVSIKILDGINKNNTNVVWVYAEKPTEPVDPENPGDTTNPGEGGEGGSTTTPGEGGEGGGTTTPGEGGEGGSTTTPGEGGEGGGTTTPGEGGEGGGTTTPGADDEGTVEQNRNSDESEASILVANEIRGYEEPGAAFYAEGDTSETEGGDGSGSEGGTENPGETTEPTDPVPLAKPTLVSATAVYTGSEITFEIGDWEETYSKYLSITEGSLTQTEIGNYKVKLEFQEGANAYWENTDNDTTYVELTFEITEDGGTTPDEPVPLAKPTLVSETAVYTGSEITFEIGDWEETYSKYLSITEGSLTQTEIGNYKVKLEFQEGANAYWENTDNDTTYVELTFEITEDDSGLAKPLPDPDDDDDNITDIPDIPIRVEKMTLTITEWVGDFPNVTVVIKEGEEYAKYIKYELTNSRGDPVTEDDIKAVEGGYTFFKIVSVIEDKSLDIKLVFEEGVPARYSYTTQFPDDEIPTFVRRPQLETVRMAYTDDNITFQMVDFFGEEWGTYYQQYLELATYVSDKLTQKEVGVYSASLFFKEGRNLAWESENGETPPYDRSAVEIIFEIFPLEINIKTSYNPIKYTGQPIDIMDLIRQEEHGKYVTAVNVSRYTNVGNYTLKLTTNVSEFGDSISFSDELTLDENGYVTVTWSIIPATLRLSWNDKTRRLNLSSDSYKGDYANVIEYLYTDVEGNKVEYDDLDPTQTYYVFANLAQAYKNNFTPTPDNILEVRYTLLPLEAFSIEREVPVFEKGEIEYNGGALRFVIKDWDELYAQYFEIIEGSAYLTQVNVGTYTIHLQAKAGISVGWITEEGTVYNNEIELTFTIKPKVLTMPDLTTEVFFTGATIDVASRLDLLVIQSSDITGATASDVGNYTLRIKLRDEYVGNFVWPEGTVFEDEEQTIVIIEWVINPAIITGTWRDDGKVDFKSTSYAGSFNDIVVYEYYDIQADEVVEYADLRRGRTYRITVTLNGEANQKNFDLKLDENPKEFKMEIDFTTLNLPTFTNSSLGYSGVAQTFQIANWDTYKAHVQILSEVSDSLTQTEVGKYSVTLHIVSSGTIWANQTVEDIVLDFSITPAILQGMWKNDGTMNITSSYLGDYDEILQYAYYYKDENGNKVVINKEDMVEGREYIVVVGFRDDSIAEKMMFAAGTEFEHTFIYEKAQEPEKTNIWPIIIGVVCGLILLIVIIIIIIIIVKKRRNNEDEDDYNYDEDDYDNENQGVDVFVGDGYEDLTSAGDFGGGDYGTGSGDDFGSLGTDGFDAGSGDYGTGSGDDFGSLGTDGFDEGSGDYGTGSGDDYGSDGTDGSDDFGTGGSF